MWIKSAKIINFRQYKDVFLTFDGDETKNLNIILGENGYGKTTLIRAFLWCLYRDNSFNDKNLLNADVARMMKPFSYEIVKVEITLEHQKMNYLITTSEEYVKDSSEKVSIHKKAVTKVLRDGKPIPDGLVDVEINKILKKDLKDYFFYDGENNKIEKVGKKSNLKDAISQMMGIKKIETLKSYFQPTGTSGVVSTLNQQYSGEDLILPIKQQDLIDSNEKLNSLKENVNTMTCEIEILNEQANEKELIISANEDVKAEQQEKMWLEENIKKQQESVVPAFDGLIATINGKGQNALLKVLYASCYKKYKISDLVNTSSFGTDQSLSHITEEAIDQLIERGVCLCGAVIENENDAYKHLIASKEHMEPHDYGKYLSDFCSSEESNVQFSINSIENINISCSQFLDKVEKIEIDNERYKELCKKVENTPDIGVYQNDLNNIKSQINHKKSQIEYINDNQIPELVDRIEGLKREVAKHSDKKRENEIIEACLDYANAIYEKACKEIKQKSEKSRVELEKDINEIFSQMYHGNLIVNITNDFQINTSTENEESLDLSTGTETVKNFAFVGGLLKSIKKLMASGEESEVYPLVLDAPFSDIDGKHIENICKLLPNYCDQLVMSMIEKDYDVAHKSIKDHINKTYKIFKHSESYATIEEVE